MANPKYADLPGIASDQPDVYETNDLPESEQGTNEAYYDDQSETVEKLLISPSEAFTKFKGQRLDASDVDFTDRIRRGPKSGYGVTSGEWEMLGTGNQEPETPLQKFQRLQHETKELLEDLNKLKETAKENDVGDNNNPAQLTKRMHQLQAQLSEINLQNALGSEMIANLTDPHRALQKKLVNEIEGFRPASYVTKEPGAISDSAANDGITYELHYKPEYGQTGTVSKVADLEQRIKKLETVLGTDNSKLSILTGHSNDKTVVSAVNSLSNKLNLLDSNNLDQIESRLGVLLQHIVQIGEHRAKFEDAEKQNKIAELFELTKKTESMAAGLAGVVQRMEGLQELHEQALQFSKTLVQLDNVQQQIVGSLKTDQNQLKQIQDTFVKNSDMIQKNVSSLDERISKLKK